MSHRTTMGFWTEIPDALLEMVERGALTIATTEVQVREALKKPVPFLAFLQESPDASR